MNTFFVSTNIQGFRRLLQTERSASLLIEVLYHYRTQGQYRLHEFVIMPNHIHLILSPTSSVTIEKAMQLIKGGFSFRAKKAFGWKESVWHRGFNDRRLRDATEYANAVGYVLENPVKARLCSNPEGWPYSSASGKFELDEVPQRLKPLSYKHTSHG
jgi:putative transposase